MKNAPFWRSRAVRHGIVWLLVISLFGLLVRAVGAGSLRTLGLRYTTLLLGVQALAIYAHFWLLTHLLERRRYGRYALATLALVAAGAIVLTLADQVDKLNIVKLQVQAGGGPPTGSLRFAQSAANVVFALVLATIARYVRRGIVSHLQVQQLRALQLETELSLLKAQVNQHFLFNTLNNLYGLSLAAPNQMPEALLQLAGLMRYQLDSSRQALVTVGTEAEYLANYIGLEKLRLRQNSRVEFQTSLPHPDQPLAPLMLLPLVENCFKHAIGPSGENTIRITLTQTATGLILRTDNSIPPHFRPTPSGLGLPALRARLAQFYPGPRHQLTLNATTTHYTATLTLQFV
ncbi:MAG: sensor histidine kinase [Hymenobacter sp.]|nr:sensor histidine kinase [Hymenobacter sp.]